MKKYMEGKEENKVLQQGKQKALKLIFGRTMVIVALFLVQFIMIGAVVRYFGQYMPVFFGGYMSFALAIVLIIINKEGSPEIKLSWSIITLLLPVVGGTIISVCRNAAGISDVAKKAGAYLQTHRGFCAAGCAGIGGTGEGRQKYGGAGFLCA